MLSDTLRNGAQSGIFKVVLGLIIVSFIFTGVGGYLIPSFDPSPARVGQIKIDAGDWNSRYNHETRRLLQFNPQVSELLDNSAYVAELRRAVLEEMISQAAVTSLAYEQGIRIGNTQVREVIAGTEAFFREGKFDNDLYLATVRSMGYSPDSFGEQVRADQSTELITKAVTRAWSRPLDNELKLFYSLVSEQRTVDLYRMPRDHFAAGIAIEEHEAQDYYAQHHSDYMQPDAVRFNYLLLSVSDLGSDLAPSTAELRDFYNLDPSKYTDAQGKQLTFDQASTQVRAEYVGARSRELFAEKSTLLADISFESPDSLDDAAQAVGLTVRDSDLVHRNDPDLSWPLNTPEVQRLCFNPENLESGLNSRVVSIDADTLIVINVYEHQIGALRPFGEVREEVAGTLRTQRSAGQVKEALQQLALQLRNGDAINLARQGVQLRPNLQLQRGSDQVSSQLRQAIYTIPNGSGFNHIIVEDGADLVLAVLKKVGSDAAHYDQYAAYLTAQWEQTQQAAIAGMLYRGARSLVDISYNEEALRLNTQQDPDRF